MGAAAAVRGMLSSHLLTSSVRTCGSYGVRRLHTASSQMVLYETMTRFLCAPHTKIQQTDIQCCTRVWSNTTLSLLAHYHTSCHCVVNKKPKTAFQEILRACFRSRRKQRHRMFLQRRRRTAFTESWSRRMARITSMAASSSSSAACCAAPGRWGGERPRPESRTIRRSGPQRLTLAIGHCSTMRVSCAMTCNWRRCVRAEACAYGCRPRTLSSACWKALMAGSITVGCVDHRNTLHAILRGTLSRLQRWGVPRRA